MTKPAINQFKTYKIKQETPEFSNSSNLSLMLHGKNTNKRRMMKK
jgi:hypothetical protein